MRRIISFVLFLCLLLPTVAFAEELTLLNADTVEEISQFVDLPAEGAVPDVARCRIRYVSLNAKDSAFVKDFWVSENYDLTSKTGRNGVTYKADNNNMHDRAVYCMALSYLGVDITPVMLSEMAGSRDVSAPFDGVTAQLENIERVEVKAYVFDTLVENYLTDDSYSPVFVKIRKPNGALHTVLVTGFIPSTGGFIICDPAAPKLDGETLHVYKMAFHVRREAVLHSAFYDAFYESEVLNIYQWRLVSE